MKVTKNEDGEFRAVCECGIEAEFLESLKASADEKLAEKDDEIERLKRDINDKEKLFDLCRRTEKTLCACCVCGGITARTFGEAEVMHGPPTCSCGGDVLPVKAEYIVARFKRLKENFRDECEAIATRALDRTESGRAFLARVKDKDAQIERLRSEVDAYELAEAERNAGVVGECPGCVEHRLEGERLKKVLVKIDAYGELPHICLRCGRYFAGSEGHYDMTAPYAWRCNECEKGGE